MSLGVSNIIRWNAHTQKHNFGASKLKLAPYNNTNIEGKTDCMTMLIYTVRCFNLCLCSSRACHRWNIDIDISTRTRSRVGFSFLTLLLSFFIITQASWGCVACSDWAWKNTLYHIKDHKHNGIYININYDQNPGTCIILTDSQKVLKWLVLTGSSMSF